MTKERWEWIDKVIERSKLSPLEKKVFEQVAKKMEEMSQLSLDLEQTVEKIFKEAQWRE